MVGACVVAIVLLAPHVARAQACTSVSVTVDANVPRYFPPQGDNSNVYPVRANLDPTGINYKDCSDDIHLAFNVTVSDFMSCADRIEVWAGTSDCGMPDARTGGDGANPCWQVAESQALASAFRVDVRARDLVANMYLCGTTGDNTSNSLA